jgi:hypothetical protein
MVIPVLEKHDSSVNKTSARNVRPLADCCKIHGQNARLIDASFGIECDSTTAVVLVMYGVIKGCGVPVRAATLMSGAGGRLSFSDFKDLLFIHTLRTEHGRPTSHRIP